MTRKAKKRRRNPAARAPDCPLCHNTGVKGKRPTEEGYVLLLCSCFRGKAVETDFLFRAGERIGASLGLPEPIGGAAAVAAIEMLRGGKKEGD